MVTIAVCGRRKYRRDQNRRKKIVFRSEEVIGTRACAKQISMAVRHCIVVLILCVLGSTLAQTQLFATTQTPSAQLDRLVLAAKSSAAQTSVILDTLESTGFASSFDALQNVSNTLASAGVFSVLAYKPSLELSSLCSKYQVCTGIFICHDCVWSFRAHRFGGRKVLRLFSSASA
jgi:hypothetical protein